MADALRIVIKDAVGSEDISQWALVAWWLLLVLDEAEASLHQESLCSICILSQFLALDYQGSILCIFSIGSSKVFMADQIDKLSEY